MTNPWYQDEKTDSGQIISSRVRLARNIKKYRFSQKLNPETATEMVKEAQDAISFANERVGRFFNKLDLKDLGPAEQKTFLEKHILSPMFLKGNLPKGLLISNDQNISIMLNEEDHVRIQSIRPGDDLGAALEMANQVDDLIEERIDYSFHPYYGYLTACPTNTGTGLRASYMIHLPCLEKSDLFKSLLPAVSKFGITIRGIYGEGTASMGSIYQISNQATLGKSEQDILECLQNVTKNVIEQETKAREKMLNSRKDDLENAIYRSYGILVYSKKISAKEAMDLLSQIRLGYLTGLLDRPRPDRQIYQIMMEIQSGHLQKMAGWEMDNVQRDTARAKYLREIFQ